MTFKPNNNHLPFMDATENDWFYDSVNYVYGKVLMRGTSDTTFSPCLGTSRSMIVTILSFGPNDPITREQLTAILYRYAQFKGMDTPTVLGKATRAETAARLMRFILNICP